LNWITRKILIFLFLSVLICGCKSSTNTKRAVAGQWEHSLVYAGDFTFGRQVNFALFTQAGRSAMLKEVKPLFKNADLAIVNGEGVISAGGYYYDKGEPRPFMYRVHPNVINVLRDAGIDVVMVGNNHSLDYGPDAMQEMLDRLLIAGIDFSGGGNNIKEARRPSYYRVGDAVVAIVGGDFTVAKKYMATENSPGILYYNVFKTSRFIDKTVKDLSSIVADAKKHANLVILSPHWGDNWLDEPAKEIRILAKKLIHIGFDAIIGHSAHVFQGAEIIDGKPVIYDAGNFVVDFNSGGSYNKAFAWELKFTKAGVTKAIGYPLLLRENVTTFAKGRVRDQILNLFKKKSQKLGTSVKTENGRVVLECDAGAVHQISDQDAAPVRDIPIKVRKAPSDIIIDAVPASAIALDVRFPNGISLVGYRLIIKDLSIPKGAQIYQTYWKTEKKITGNYKIYLEARKKDSGEVRAESHMPGDWIMPVEQWPTDKVIRDWALFRLTFIPKGEVSFYAGLKKDGRFVKPVSSSAPLKDQNLVYLGDAGYKKSAKRIFYYYNKFQADFINRQSCSTSVIGF
jgi:poly-gamma-glutamate capsule biosynthesis protein CapA/YwtB (metallophosphatase superfamily)